MMITTEKMFFRLRKSIQYLLFSGHRRGHGIHSPFVFNLITEVFRNKSTPDVVLNIEKARKRLKKDKRIIKVADYGAGSKKAGSYERRVSDIARYSSIPKKYGLLLYHLAAEFGGKDIIELGTSLGISTLYLASGSPGSTVHTIEGSSEIAAMASANIKDECISNIRLYEGTFDYILPLIIKSGLTPGLVFVDGNHRKEPVLNYFRLLLTVVSGTTVIVFDDINYSAEMNEAWQEIKRNERISLSIDLNRMGIVFFKEGITHNDYIIRY